MPAYDAAILPALAVYYAAMPRYAAAAIFFITLIFTARADATFAIDATPALTLPCLR